MSAFWRNLAILAVVALLVVVFNQETALSTAALLLRFAFIVMLGVVAYFFWRDIGRREISTWPDRAARVFYAAAALFVVDLGWFMIVGLAGRDLLAFAVVAAVCIYVGFRTWRGQRSAL